MTRFHPVERRFEAFLRKPLSVRKAMGVEPSPVSCRA
jgi:hypothetical protein